MKTKKFALAPNANTDHASARDMYDAYGWHLDTEHCGSVTLQAVEYDWLDKPDAEVAAALVASKPKLRYSEAREIVAQAREIRCVMNMVEAHLADAVRKYKAGDLHRVVNALNKASVFEKEHGDDPETRALRAKLFVEVDEDEDEGDDDQPLLTEFDTSKPDLGMVWHVLETPVYCILTEGVHKNDAMIRRLSPSTWIWFDNQDGYDVLTDESVNAILTGNNDCRYELNN